MRQPTPFMGGGQRAAQHTDVAILSSGVAEAVAALKAESGKDVWLFGGGVRLLPPDRRWPLRFAD